MTVANTFALLLPLLMGLRVVGGGGLVDAIGAITVEPPDGSFVALGRGAESGTLVMAVATAAVFNCTALTLIALPNGVPESEAALRMPLELDHAACTCTFSLKNVQPGTQVMEFIVRHADNNAVARTSIHLEVVPFSLVETRYVPSKPTRDESNYSSASLRKLVRKPIRVLIVGTLSLDGQKTIWLEQIARLSRSEFSFKYACFVCSDSMVSDQIRAQSGMAYELRKLGITIMTRNGFDINRNIVAAPGFPQSATAVLRRWHNFQHFPNLASFSPEEFDFIHAFKACFIQLFGVNATDILV